MLSVFLLEKIDSYNFGRFFSNQSSINKSLSIFSALTNLTKFEKMCHGNLRFIYFDSRRVSPFFLQNHVHFGRNKCTRIKLTLQLFNSSLHSLNLLNRCLFTYYTYTSLFLEVKFLYSDYCFYFDKNYIFPS